MIVRRLAARRLVRKGSTEEEPKRKRGFRFFLVIFTAGTLAGSAAWLGIWPFGNVQRLVKDVFGNGSNPVIAAKTVFPSVQPTHQTVNVYDPAPPARQTAPPAQQSPRPSQSPLPSGSPRPSPPPDE